MAVDEQSAGAVAEASADTRHLVAASSVVTGLMIVAKLIGLVTQGAIAAVFGANRATDALRIALSIPPMFSTWVEMPIRAAMVPLFTRKLHAEGEAAAWRAASNILNTIGLGLLILVGLLLLAAEPVVRIAAPGFRSPEIWKQSAFFARIVVPSIFFSVLAVLLGSLQNVYRRQQFPALGRVLNGVALLVCVLWLGRIVGLSGWAVGVLAGSVLAFALQLGVLWRHRRYYRWRVAPRAPEVREAIALVLPLFVGLTGTRVDVFIEQLLASFLPEGHLSTLAFAVILVGMMTDPLISVTSSVLLPHFGHLAAQGRLEDLRHRLTQAVTGYLFLILPLVAVLLPGSLPVARLVFGWGKMTPDQIALTASLMPVLALAAPVFAVGQVLAQAHIGRGDTRTPMAIGLWRVGVKIVLSLALLPGLGVLGLAAASAASSYFRTTLLWRRLPEPIRPPGRLLARHLASLLTATAAGALAVAGLLAVLPEGRGFVMQTVRLGAAAGGGGLVYLAAALAISHQARAVAGRLLRRAGLGR
ncbi:MAG: hypothetical protein D6718_07735 [Acidobacteria bacterium]|nr:MAG: hypothetical protein D6718_07735 [Acidobacteriota bacterium]